jgi:hypothetical protein
VRNPCSKCARPPEQDSASHLAWAARPPSVGGSARASRLAPVRKRVRAHRAPAAVRVSLGRTQRGLHRAPSQARRGRSAQLPADRHGDPGSELPVVVRQARGAPGAGGRRAARPPSDLAPRVGGSAAERGRLGRRAWAARPPSVGGSAAERGLGEGLEARSRPEEGGEGAVSAGLAREDWAPTGPQDGPGTSGRMWRDGQRSTS